MRPSLPARVRGLVTSPQRELVSAIADRGDIRALVPYVLPLVAIGAVARFASGGLIGIYTPPDAVLFGMSIGGGFVRTPLQSAIGALLSMVIAVVAWLLLGWLLAVLAPRFGGRRDLLAARKTAAFIATPVALAGITALFASVPHFAFVEPLAHVGALGYGVLLGHWSLPLYLGTPETKSPGHVLAAVGLTCMALGAVWIVVFTVILAN
jgi:uncharacterized membrane protein